MIPHKKKVTTGGGDTGNLTNKRNSHKRKTWTNKNHPTKTDKQTNDNNKKQGQKEIQAVLLWALTFSQKCVALVVLSCSLD